MRIFLAAFALILFLVPNLVGQETNSKDSFLYWNNNNQQAITYSVPVYLGYKYAYCFNQYLGFGAGISMGLRASNFFDEPSEIAKFDIFYRIYLNKTIYLDAGGFIAYYGETDAFRGFEGELFYGWERIKIGHGIQVGEYYHSNSDNPYCNFDILYTPIILQFNF